jgi:hypothetical protein
MKKWIPLVLFAFGFVFIFSLAVVLTNFYGHYFNPRHTDIPDGTKLIGKDIVTREIVYRRKSGKQLTPQLIEVNENGLMTVSVGKIKKEYKNVYYNYLPLINDVIKVSERSEVRLSSGQLEKIKGYVDEIGSRKALPIYQPDHKQTVIHLLVGNRV